MKRILFVLILASVSSSAYAADFSLEKIKAGDIAVKAAVVPAPVPALVKADPQVPQDLLNKFQQVYNELNAVRSDLTWVRSDLDRLENRALQMIQINYHDSFFQSDLRKTSMDMSNRFNNMQRAALDAHNLLALAQKSADLNKSAKDMDVIAREILGDTWPALEDAAGRLEGTVREGKPEVVGYDAQWTAMDISRYARQLSDQARNASSDTRTLISKTQP